MRSGHAGKQIGAGIGWYQWGDGRGVFVEPETIGSTRGEVASKLDYRIGHSLRDLCAARNVPFDMQLVRSQRVLAEVKDRQTCALALAVFQAEGWRGELANCEEAMPDMWSNTDLCHVSSPVAACQPK
jgi:hypothetical protein